MKHVIAGIALLLVACSSSNTSTASRDLDNTTVPTEIIVTSVAFANGAAIPRANTCDGGGTPPTVAWRGIPTSAKSVAVVVDDPDAPRGTFVHWVVTGLKPGSGSVPTDVAGVHELDNTAGTHGWTPPCPPPGATHHYRFTVYALRDYICAANGDDSSGPDCSPPGTADALAQIRGAAIAKGAVVGTYRR